MVERGVILASHNARTLESDSLGSRNERILALRRDLFGPSFQSLAQCPGCGSYAELSFHADDMQFSPTEGVEHRFASGEYEAVYHSPNSLDLAYLSRFDDEEQAEAALLARCVTEARRNGEKILVEALPPEFLEELDTEMDRVDPFACQRIELTCPECAVKWTCIFDVASFVWREVSTAGKRTLQDVHDLARAYGWTEEDVFKLSPSRRQMYLEMVNG